MLKKRENQVIQIAIVYHLLTNVRVPFPNPDRLPFWVTPPTIHTGQDILWCGISFGQFGPPVPAVLPPIFLCIPPLHLSMKQWKNILD